MSTGAIIAIVILVIILIVGAGLIYYYFVRTTDVTTPTTPAVTTTPTTPAATTTPTTPAATPTVIPNTPANTNPIYRAPYNQQVSPAWITMTGKSWSGNDIKTGGNVANFDECANIIRSAGTTIGTYDPVAKICYVKKLPSSNGVFGMYNPGNNTYFRFDGGDFSGHDISGASTKVSDVGACEDVCRKTPQCEGYFFSKSDNVCYPKKPEDYASTMISGVFKY